MMVRCISVYFNAPERFLHTDVPEAPAESDGIHKTLNALGVSYTHRNEELMLESAVEGKRFEINLQVNYRK